jgi:hypothetical protein
MAKLIITIDLDDCVPEGVTRKCFFAEDGQFDGEGKRVAEEHASTGQVATILRRYATGIAGGSFDALPETLMRKVSHLKSGHMPVGEAVVKW